METSTPEELFGRFYGHDYDFAQCEALAFRPVPSRRPRGAEKSIDVPTVPPVSEELMCREPELQARTWFDYRGLHSSKRTLLFAHLWNRGHRDAYARHIDRAEAELQKAYNKDNVFRLTPKEIEGFVLARQTADDLFIPYPHFIRQVFTCCMEEMLYKHLPRPKHAALPEVQAFAVEFWMNFSRARLNYSLDRRYLIENYIGHSDQDAHQTWLLSNAGYRQHPEYVLAEVVFQRPMLAVERAEAVFGSEKIALARQFAASK